MIDGSAAPIPIQIITSSFDSFNDDVLQNYDCSLVSVGFSPSENTFIFNNRFVDGLQARRFICQYENTDPERVEKLTIRSKNWFGCEFVLLKHAEDADFRPYSQKEEPIESISDIVAPPKYIQLWHAL